MSDFPPKSDRPAITIKSETPDTTAIMSVVPRLVGLAIKTKTGCFARNSNQSERHFGGRTERRHRQDLINTFEELGPIQVCRNFGAVIFPTFESKQNNKTLCGSEGYGPLRI